LSPDFLALGFEKRSVNKRPHWFKDNGSDILAVAHLDTVQKKNTFGRLNFENETRVYHPKLDDRLGAFIILHMLPEMNINVDILFTTDEEICNSTAKDFQPDKDYKWIVEFDRAGEDVVLYDFESKEIVDALTSVGFEIGIGSYTDICDLNLGVVGFNVGVGYENPHSYTAYFVVETLVSQLEKFKLFYNKYKDVVFEWQDEWDLYDETDQSLCPDCFSEVFEYQTGKFWCDNCREIFNQNNLDGYSPLINWGIDN